MANALRIGRIVVLAAVGVMTIGSGAIQQLYAQNRSQRSEQQNSEQLQAWTFDDAVRQLQLYPRDTFLQYVVLKLGQRQGFDATTMAGMGETSLREIANQRREQVDLFSLFSGATAVQESLQLDAMRPGNRGRELTVRQKSVSVSELVGPEVESHPWQEMLAGRTPTVSELAGYVPDDQYYIRFRSVSRMLDVLDGGDLFAKHLYTQSGVQSFSRQTDQQLRTQLAIETSQLARPFYDLVVKELVMTGGDPFVSEGSDVTLLFRFDQEALFRSQLDGYLAAAEKSRDDTTRTEGAFAGIPFVHVTSPERSVHVYSAYPAPGLHVRSNSQVAFQRVLSLITGRGDQDLVSLAATDEFRYIRTLMPLDAEEEDGLIYLSDPFIRRLVGPQVKLTEYRRLLCQNHLRIMGHATALFQAEQGRLPESLEELVKHDCLPNEFGSGPLTCPCGGHYSLSGDHMRGVCTHHGHADLMIP
ncbi:MAG: hypothetical protein KDA85_16480, partial [Planctomycetaceae bacterium]|nr:hypothetical protein [Planctomycetaceae bacterium]